MLRQAEEADEVPAAVRDEALGLAFWNDSLDRAKDASRVFRAARKQRLKGERDKARELMQEGIDAAKESRELMQRAIRRFRATTRAPDQQQ